MENKFLGPYEVEPSVEFLKSNTYAFASNSNYFPNPYFGFEIIKSNNEYLNFNPDGSRSIGNNMTVKSLYELESNSENIFLYGGSVMFGSYAPSDASTIGGFLARDLGTANIFNFGLPGSIILQNFSHYFNVVYPQICAKKSNNSLIILFGFNEYKNIFHHHKKYFTPIIGPIQSTLGNSALSRLINKTNRARFIKNESTSSNPLEESLFLFEAINRFVEILGQMGTKVFLLFQPISQLSTKTKFGPENHSISNSDLKSLKSFYSLAEKKLDITNSRFHNLITIFDREERQIFLDEVHVGDIGNRIIANEIRRIIQKI